MDAPHRVLVDPVAEPGGEAPIDGARMAAALRANAGRIAAGVAAVTLLALAVALLSPDRYRATARITHSPAGQVASASTSGSDPRGLATSVAFVTTPAVLAEAARHLPGETADSLAGKVTASVQSGADVIDVHATDGRAARAAAIANAVAAAFLDQRAAAARATYQRSARDLQARLAGAPPDLATAIRSRLGELAVQQADAGGDLTLAEAAQPPAAPYAPNPARTAVVAFFAALLVGVLAVIVLERVRPRAGGARDLARLAGVPLLATVPGRRSSGADGLAGRARSAAGGLPDVLRRPVQALADAQHRRGQRHDAASRAAADEAIHAMLGAVLLELPPGGRKLVLVTSPGRDQGTAWVAARLAAALAEAGQWTLALSVDRASPALAAELGVPPGPGLAEALARADSVKDPTLRLSAATGASGVAVVPSGGPPPDGVGLLRPRAVETLLRAIDASVYGYVVVEAPDLLRAPETRLIGRHADAALLVCPERAAAGDVADAREALGRLDAPLLGVVATRGDGAPASGHEPAPAPAVEPAAPADAASNGSGERAEELVARLRDAGRPLTWAELSRAASPSSPAGLRAQLRRLIARGEIERSGSGRRGDPYLYAVREP